MNEGHENEESGNSRALEAKTILSRTPAALLFKSGNAKNYQRRLA